MVEKKRKGFTLIELLVVISIIALLSSVVLSSLSTARGRANDAKRNADMKAVKTALATYKNEYGNYPNEGGWRTSVSGGDWISSDPNFKKFLSNQPVDPKQVTTSYGNGNARAGEYQYLAYNNLGCYVLIYGLESTTGSSLQVNDIIETTSVCNNLSMANSGFIYDNQNVVISSDL